MCVCFTWTISSVLGTRGCPLHIWGMSAAGARGWRAEWGQDGEDLESPLTFIPQAVGENSRGPRQPCQQCCCLHHCSRHQPGGLTPFMTFIKGSSKKGWGCFPRPTPHRPPLLRKSPAQQGCLATQWGRRTRLPPHLPRTCGWSVHAAGGTVPPDLQAEGAPSAADRL